MDLIALIHQSRLETWNYIYTLWQRELFGPQWWTVFIFIATAYIIWWKLADKSRLAHLLLFGSFISVFRVIFDDMAVGMAFFTYKVRLVPMTHALFFNDLTVIPLVYMLVHQYTSTWRSFFLWSAVWSGIWAFVIVPLFDRLGILVIHDWKYYYSFIVLLLIGIFSRFVFLLVIKVEQGYSVRHSVGDITKTMLHPAMKPFANKDQQDKE